MRWVVALVLLGGCSFVFANVPPAPLSEDCRQLRAYPLYDVIFGVGAEVGGTLAIVYSDATPRGWSIDWHEVEVGAGVALLVDGVIYFTSAIYGVRQRSKCKELVATTVPAAERRRQSMMLFDEAERAALRHDCQTTRYLLAKIGDVDPEILERMPPNSPMRDCYAPAGPQVVSPP